MHSCALTMHIKNSLWKYFHYIRRHCDNAKYSPQNAKQIINLSDLQPVCGDDLPGPKGPFSSAIPRQAATEANKHMQEAAVTQPSRKWGSYMHFGAKTVVSFIASQPYAVMFWLDTVTQRSTGVSTVLPQSTAMPTLHVLENFVSSVQCAKIFPCEQFVHTYKWLFCET